MARPRVKDGHIRIANELWHGWMRTGPLKERVFKAIVWECWGYKDRRDAKQPVSITRGRIAELTGIADKSRISKIVKELVSDRVIDKYCGGPLGTPAYWPNKDYESWVMDECPSGEIDPRVSLDPRGESDPDPRVSLDPIPRVHLDPPHLITNSNKVQEEGKEGKGAPSGAKTPLFALAYLKRFKPGSQLAPKERYAAIEFEDTCESYNEFTAAAIVEAWWEHEFKHWKSQPENKNEGVPGFFYFIRSREGDPIITRHLKAGTLPGQKRSADKSPGVAPVNPYENYPTIEEMEAEIDRVQREEFGE